MGGTIKRARCSVRRRVPLGAEEGTYLGRKDNASSSLEKKVERKERANCAQKNRAFISENDDR